VWLAGLAGKIVFSGDKPINPFSHDNMGQGIEFPLRPNVHFFSCPFYGIPNGINAGTMVFRGGRVAEIKSVLVSVSDPPKPETVRLTV